MPMLLKRCLYLLSELHVLFHVHVHVHVLVHVHVQLQLPRAHTRHVTWLPPLTPAGEMPFARQTWGTSLLGTLVGLVCVDLPN